jgi:alpha-methylacyl-CoA racemase
MSGPLTGVNVLVLAGMGPVPYVSMLLADLGVHVVRISRPPKRAARALALNSGLPAEYDVVNRGVETVELDLKDPGDLERVRELVGLADAFVEGFRPGVAERLGLGPEDLQEIRPSLVYLRLTGYGQTGPRAQEAGHDLNYVAQSGVLRALGRREEAPHPPVNLLGDYAGGGALGALGLVAALFEARASGQGQVVDAAMADGVAYLAAKLHGLRAAGLHTDEAGTNTLDTGAPFYDTYRCADGEYLAVGALEPDFYAEFLSRLGVDTADWPAQYDEQAWPELRERIAEVIAGRTRDAWAETFAGTDSCVSPVLGFDEAAADPHNESRGVYRRVGPVLHPAPAPRFSRTPHREPAAPRTGPVGADAVAAAWRQEAAGSGRGEA